MRRLRGKVFLYLICLLLFSCSQNQSARYKLDSFVENPRVFYGETGFPIENETPSATCESLSLEEVNLIQNKISEVTDKTIWFARVPLSSSKGRRGQIWVYLAPDLTNTRYRLGEVYTINIYTSTFGKLSTKISPPSQYIQVSLPDKTFNNILSIPEVYDLPFEYPPLIVNDNDGKSEIFTPKELIYLIDYVREPNNYLNFEDFKITSKESIPGGIRVHVSASFPLPKVMSQEVVSKPLVNVVQDSDEYRVTIGFVHGGLYARCITVMLKKTKTGYEIINWNSWIS